jgi:hypothetical protein
MMNEVVAMVGEDRRAECEEEMSEEQGRSVLVSRPSLI